MPPPSPPPTARVLLVDDRPANLIALEAILEPLGQPLVKASSGREALQEVLGQEFALILLDVQMPEMDGFETARLLKGVERTRDIPIIFLTAISREESHICQGYAHGAVDYLVKPFPPDILLSKVRVFTEMHGAKTLAAQSALDQAERLRTELERQAELRFRSLVESLPQGVVVLRPDGEPLFVNRTWTDFSGLTAEESRSANLRALLHPDDAATVEATWWQSLQEQKRFAFEGRLKNRSGEYRWQVVQAHPEKDARGVLVRWVCTTLDVDDLRRAQLAKDNFLSMAAHELRTPLQGALGFLHLAERPGEGLVPERVSRSLKGISRSLQRMSRLVENLLDVSRLEQGRLELEPALCELEPLLQEAMEQFSAEAGPERFSLEVTPPGLEWTADRVRLEQVIVNLLSNALRYSPDGGRVHLTAQAEDEGLHLTVRDEGVGIPPGQQSVIFERFGRAHGTSFGGLGLGLTIAQGIVQRHGGRLWFESSGQPGEGTTFHVVLPKTPPASTVRR